VRTTIAAYYYQLTRSHLREARRILERGLGVAFAEQLAGHLAYAVMCRDNARRARARGL